MVLGSRRGSGVNLTRMRFGSFLDFYRGFFLIENFFTSASLFIRLGELAQRRIGVCPVDFVLKGIRLIIMEVIAERWLIEESFQILQYLPPEVSVAALNKCFRLRQTQFAATGDIFPIGVCFWPKTACFPFD